MKRMAHRLAVLGVAGGMVLTMPAAAVAQTGKAGKGGTDCVVEHVDERGEVRDTSTEPEGAVYGQFRCEGGQWVFAWAPFERDDAITAGEVQVDPAGTVSVRRFAGPALGNDLTVAEMAGIVQALSGSKEVMFDRAVVAVDDGKERTPEEIEALLAGKDTTGVRVLGTVEWPDPAKSSADLIDEVGGTPETTVVYFSIWGAIKDAIAWVVDTLNDIGDWLENHCWWGPPSQIGVVVTCQW
jgi:hypothetical protein